MDTNLLEELLECGRETQSLDFKGPCKWDVKKFAKDILAMANVIDGGYLIVGIEERKDGHYRRTGLSEEQLDTFKLDIIKDQMAAYADPHLDITFHRLKDLNNLSYAIIQVHPFEEIPVICNKDSNDTKKATLYYRNRSRRIESAPVSNSYDLREIIERAAIKRMQKIQLHGLSIKGSQSVDELLDEEIRDL